MQKHSYKLVCVGGGVGVGYLVQTLLDEGFAPDDICILTADDRPPYERPSLSKDILTADEEFDDIWINSPQFYTDHEIAIELHTNVHKIDTESRHAFTDLGVYTFDQLVIATGAHPKKLNVPGADQDAIHYLRVAQDAQRIREAATHAQSAVVVGGSFIGMEVASSLRKNGLDVTLVFPEQRVWQAIFTPEMSDFFADYYRDEGVSVRNNVTVTEFLKKDEGVFVLLNDGSQIPADMVVAGVGVTPNVEPFAESGIKIEDGIITDEYLETNIEGIFAIGDVAKFHDPKTGTHRRIEHWDNAVEQGKTLAKTLAGRRTAFNHVPYFFSDVFDLSYEMWGFPDDYDTAVYRGDLSQGAFSTWWLKGGKLQAAFVMDRPDEEREQAQEWLESGAELSPSDLAESTGIPPALSG